MLAGFLHSTISDQIESVDNVELEYESTAVPPKALGEIDGQRGYGQTSPDVAFEVTTRPGNGVVLVECKFVEHGFYSCAGRKKKDARGRVPNPNPSRCLNYSKVLEDPARECHLVSWNRRYWDHLRPVADRSAGARLSSCPAAFGGYQLLRQHALAEAIAANCTSLVVSAVAYDGRNVGLMKCLSRSTGLPDVGSGWQSLFCGRAVFKIFTHQAWVSWVADHDRSGEWADWVSYVRDRYGF